MSLLFFRLVLLFFFFFNQVNGFEQDKCSKFIKETEQNLNIPNDMLLSIALTESGRNVDGEFFPWPWAINIEGKGYFLKNEEQLIQFAKENLKNDNKNFDLGCMQINYYFHGKKFKDLAEMINPESNVKWAGSFLLKLKEKHNSWKEAISRYHSNTKWRKEQYLSKVMNNWGFLNKEQDVQLAIVDKTKEEEKNIDNSIQITTMKNKESENDLTKNMDSDISEGLIYEEVVEIEVSDENEIIAELSEYLPDNIIEIQVINEFEFLDNDLILDNLERVNDLKNN
mgnify:CR=1 FL=1|tara:strand:- start:153 stop:1001 length:849 start_codon:yes stop_codon:yes gene_type:complete